MPLYTFKCSSCGEIVEEWAKVAELDELKEQSCSCGGARETVLQPCGIHWGGTAHIPGEIRQFDMEWTDRDGKKHYKSVKDKCKGPKGKLTNSDWDGKNVHPEDVPSLDPKH